MFKKIEPSNRVVEYTIKNYTESNIITYLNNPIAYQSQLIDLNNFMYATSGFFRELIEYYIKPIKYRWTINTVATNSNFEKVKIDKIKKDFIAYSAKINQLNIGRELHRLLLKMFLEDLVCGYWLEEGENSTIYYFPSTWVIINSTVNGNWTYKINTSKISQTQIEKLPKEIQTLINKYKGKSGELAYAEVPFEKSVCFKYNDTINYIFPPFVYVIPLIIDLEKSKQISLTAAEQSAMDLLEMRIPIDETDDDHLRLTEPTIRQFAVGVQDLLPSNVAVLPTPMPLSVLDTKKSTASETNVIENTIKAFGEETGYPGFGSSDTAAEMKRAIENASSKVFVILDQISNVINLKMKYDGFSNYSSYEFQYEILHITTFNEIETQDNLLKQAQAGAVNKFTREAANGKNPAMLIGQSYVENTVFRDMFDNATVPPSSHTQTTSDDEGGAPEKSEDDLTESGTQTKEQDQNNPANRDI